jgi:predicted outer membrane protein
MAVLWQGQKEGELNESLRAACDDVGVALQTPACVSQRTDLERADLELDDFNNRIRLGMDGAISL